MSGGNAPAYEAGTCRRPVAKNQKHGGGERGRDVLAEHGCGEQHDGDRFECPQQHRQAGGASSPSQRS
jgi:hypothetical protein